MKTFAQMHNQPETQQSSSFTRSNARILGANHPESSSLYVQPTIGHQAALRPLETHTENLNAGVPGTALPAFEHDFSRIPIHEPIQTKLAINQPGDIYEEEADRISEQVMNTSVPQLQPAPSHQTEQPGQQHEHLLTKKVASSDFEPTAVPPIVHEVLRSPGQPLDPASRLFMEPRFGYDFSNLRLHTDVKAGESAQAIGAAAYTVGNNLVFGAGEFNPRNGEGRRLIAHELTHVVQQSNGTLRIQQQPKKKGRVVRVERPSKPRPKPPGPGLYTFEELRKWYDTHPNRKKEKVDLVNGKRTQNEEYSPEVLWVKGYDYAITHLHGDRGTEIWVNNDDHGKVIGIDREIP
ncbi:MAG TPA: DUF4157 domain-containing protein [Blastocatellia bacterium]|nr:DUF4157 domain-containing protein [Blastocatellia bacterium]